MVDTRESSYWAAPALLGAVLAALGYLGKLCADFALKWRNEARKRRARLGDLLAILSAGDVAFLVQTEIRDRLYVSLSARLPGLGKNLSGFDTFFSRAYSEMLPEESRLHAIIRAYTIYALKPLNEDILRWLRTDIYFRGLSPSHPRYGKLVVYLRNLQAHLLLWHAKYETWIPSDPAHSLVYLDDEERHGLGFPRGGTELVATLLGQGTPSTASQPIETKREDRDEA